MVRIAVLADIHGNLQALKAVFSDLRRHRVDRIIVAGDLICDCADSNEVVSMVAACSSCVVIAGNREEYLLQFASGMQDHWRTLSQWSSLVWTFDNLVEENQMYLKNLPEVLSLSVGGIWLRIVHGSPISNRELLYPKTERLTQALESIPEEILICAHSHEQWDVSVNTKTALNPGSVGVHFNGTSSAEYSILEVNGRPSRITIKHLQVSYDLEETISRFNESGLMAYSPIWSHTIIQGLIHGRNITVEFLRKAFEMQKEITGKEVDVVTNETWRKAALKHLGIAI